MSQEGPGATAPEEIQREIEEMIVREFIDEEEGEEEANVADIDLLQVLDSVRILRLCTALEERFGIEIEDEEISVENVSSVGRLAALVQRKREGS